MKNYRITVNGVAYDVTVEEISGDQAGSLPAAAAPAAVTAPAAPAAPPRKAPAKSSSAVGGVKINAPMPGKIVDIKVKAGQKVDKGQVVVVLEAMKMENEICAPQAGTIATVDISVGDGVEGGDVLATMN